MSKSPFSYICNDGQTFPSPSESPPVKRQRRSRNTDLAKDIDAEGNIFDDPCLPCRSKNISCLVSPKSTRCATCARGGNGCSATSSIQLSRTYGSLAAVQARKST